MDQNILLAAKELLEQPTELEEISIQRAAIALGVNALTLGFNHRFGFAEYLIYPQNLYLIFDGHAAKDENGNFDSPIFQEESPNGSKPLWQEFRERLEEKLGTSVSHIFFGDYKIEGSDEFFTVKNEPKDCRWRYTKKRKKGTIFITRLTKRQALEYQAILDDLRLERAIKIVQARTDHEQSRLCRTDTITTLNSKYPEEFDRFTFNDTTFRFRQFTTEFLYTPAGLEAFDKFYVDYCIPYRNDEIAEAEWREKSSHLQKILYEDDDFASELLRNNVSKFTLTQLDNGSCRVESDLIDDRTGHQFSVIVKSQRFDDILSAVDTELTVVFQRKRQIRRATSILHQFASQK